MLERMNFTRFAMSSDITLRAILRNFGDDFTQFYLTEQLFGVKSLGFTTSTWDGICRYSQQLRSLMRPRTEVQFKSGFLKQINFIFVKKITNNSESFDRFES